MKIRMNIQNEMRIARQMEKSMKRNSKWKYWNRSEDCFEKLEMKMKMNLEIQNEDENETKMALKMETDRLR